MALHKVKTPDGQILNIDAPDDASEEDILGFAQSQYKPITQQKRTWGEALTDVGGGLISGVGSLMQLPGQVGQLTGITEAEEKPTGLQGIGKTVEEFGQGLKSPVLKAKEQIRSQKIAEAEGEGGALDVAKQAGIAFYETIKDPALITSFFAEQVPNLIGTMGGGLLARGGVKLLMKEATEAAVGKAGVAGAVGTGTIMQGADVGSDTYEQVFKRLVKEGTDEEEANRIALEQGRQAALQAAGISLGTAFLPGGRSIERALAGKGAPGVGGFARGFIGETGSEALEEGGGQFVSNVAQQEIFPDVSLTRGVGEAAGMGALGGGLFGGVAGGVNARRDAQFEEQQQLAADAEQAVQIAAEQERIAANDAANAEIKRRAYAEEGGITTSKAYEELVAEVEEAQAKLAKAEERRLAAQAKVDAKKAKDSAFTDAQPDLLGDVLPDQTQQTQQTQQEEVPAAPQAPAPGQLELQLTDQEGQLGLPGIGAAQPSPTVEQPAPVESLVISRPLTKALGIPGGARNILNAIEGKDLTDPEQRAEVRDALTAFAERTTKPGVAGNIEKFLNSPFFAETQELPLTDTQGQLGLPEVGLAQPREVQLPEVEAPLNVPVITAQSVSNLGFPKDSPVREQLVGKDLIDPAQRAEVRNVLQGELNSGDINPKSKLYKNLQTALTNSPFLQVQAEMLGPRGGVLNPVQRGRQIPVTETPTAQETQDVATGEQPRGIPPTEPAIGRRASEQGVGVAGVGTGTASLQTSAPQRVQESGSGRLADTTGRTQRDVQGTAGAPTAVTTPAQIPKNLKGPARFEAEYLAEANNDRAAMLKNLAADVYAKENMRRANPVLKLLSAEERAQLDAQVKALKDQEKRGVEFLSKMNAAQEQIRDYASGLKAPPEVRRVASGFTTPGLIAAAHRGSMARALNEIANNPKYSPLERMVARRLMENKMYSLPKLQVVPKAQLGEADGQYDPMTDTVRIADGAVDSHTVLHEAVHGYVHALITRFESGEVSNRALADLQRLYNHLLSNNPELAKQYGMTSLTEFASEAMSNADFQAALAQIPYQRTNLFTEFVKKVMELLGIGNMDTALGEALIQVERAMNVGRGYQESISGKAGAPAPANVVRGNKAELEALFKAANGRDVAGKNANPVGSALNENTKANEAEAARTLTTMLDKFETGFLSFDAGLNNAIRRELNKDKRDWTTIKNIMTKISTAQALHSEALAMQFLEKGALRYDPTSYKFFAEDKPDSWKSMMAKMSEVAKSNGLTDAELRNYANTAFIAERVEGLAKSKPEFYSHMTKEQVAAGKRLFDKIDGLRDVQKIWNGIRANAMDVAVDNGLYSRKEADELLQYMDFVPFYREEQLETGGGPRKYPNGFIDFAKNFRIKGSDQPVADVFGNMALWTTYTVSRAVRNRTALNMYETAKEVMPDQVEDIRQDATVKRSDNVVQFRENGQIKKVKFADPLFVKAFEGMESVTIPTLKEFAKFTNFLRQSIVLNPLFSISQLSQDSFAAMMTSGLKNPLQIPFEVVRQFFNILMGTNATGKYLSRAGVVGVNDYSSAVQNNNLAVASGLKPKSVLQKLLTPLEAFSMASDNAVRQALYNRTLLETGGVRQKDGSVKGGDEAAALEKAFEIITLSVQELVV